MFDEKIEVHISKGKSVVKNRYVKSKKKADYSSRFAQQRIIDELNNMKHEIVSSEKGSRSIHGYGKDQNVTVTKSTFPEYMKESGINSTKDFLKVLTQKKGVRFDRLKKKAIERLENGYKNKHGYDEPDIDFLVKTKQMHDNKDVIFRRVGGRVVPIKVTKRNRYDLLDDAPF